MPQKVNLFWFRRDLRIHDNAGLYHALSTGLPVVPFFIFDTAILDELQDKADSRVNFILQSLEAIDQELVESGSALDVYYGTTTKVFLQLVKEFDIATVFTNHDYEPYATKRDAAIKAFLTSKGIGFKTFKDQVIFEKNEVVKENNEPYAVFTSYSKKWKSLLTEQSLVSFNEKKFLKNFYQHRAKPLPSLKELGFVKAGYLLPHLPVNEIIEHYNKTRDFPSLQGTTRLGIHLRFGTISIRQLVKKAVALNGTFLNELIWREFFMQLLWQQPGLVTEAYKKQYDAIKWRNNEKEFDLWCHGKTGYPIVDAGMRQLNETGFMHNRVRMITGSFLVKHLLIDWRWGEAYFAKKLLDYELAANNGNWQWVAGCGCDAAPYFRIFNPAIQTKKFDPKLEYIKKWVPEFQEFAYPRPMVDLMFARDRCLKVYKAALQSN